MSANYRVMLGGALLLAATSAPASAQTIITDRPDFTESTATVPQGRFQIEAGYTYATIGDLTAHEIGEGLIRYGVIPGLELRIGVPSFLMVSFPDDLGPISADGEDTGFGESSVGLKLGLYESGLAEGLPSVALLVGTTLPGGNQEVGASPPWEPSAVLALGWSFTETLTLGANVGYTQRVTPIVNEDRFDEFSASVAVGFPIFGSMSGFAEYFAIRPNFEDFDLDEDYVDGGITYLLSPTFQLDARVGLGVGDTEDAMFFGVGLAKLF